MSHLNFFPPYPHPMTESDRSVSKPWLAFFRRWLDAYDDTDERVAALEAAVAALQGGGTIGTWTDVSFDASMFTANGSMVWTVGASNVDTFAWMKIGPTMWVNLYLTGTTVSGVANDTLSITIPGGYMARKNTRSNWFVRDAGTIMPAFGGVLAGGSTIAVQQWTAGAVTNFTVGGGPTTQVRGVLQFDVLS